VANRLRIDEMKPEDLDDVCRIEKETFLADAWPRSTFEADMEDDSAYCPVIRDALGKVVAYANLRIFTDEAYITNLAVERRMRRMGIGGLLTRHLIEKAESEECCAISLDVRVSNAEAQSLYRKFGFRELNRTKNYYQNPLEDSVVMVRDLGERNNRG
jgi:ribosomal-protein-alanine N-acetyltransferase